MKKWYHNPLIVILLLLFFFPIGVILLWKNKRFNKNAKLALSLLFGLIFIFAVLSSNDDTSNNSMPSQTPTIVNKTPEPTQFATPILTPTPLPTEKIKPIKLELSIDPINSNNTISFDISTNLPDHTQGTLTLISPANNYTKQLSIIIADGHASTDSFTLNGEALPGGDYSFEFTTANYTEQPNDVKEKLGENYHNYYGPDIITSEISNEKCIQYTQSFTLNDLPVEEITPAENTPEQTNDTSTIQSTQNSNGVTVYWTNKGKRYHSDPDCSNMNSPYSGTIEEAEAAGKTPCKKCY